MKRSLWLAAQFALAGVAILVTYQQLPALFDAWQTEQPAQWWAARSTGFVALVALTLSMLFGLMVSSRGLDGGVARGTVLEHHQQWSLAALVAVIVHVLVIVTDDYVSITVSDALVPGVSEELTGPIALGAISFWLIALLMASSWARDYLPFVAWRVIPTAALAAFVLGLVHGFTAGTDSDLPVVQVVYVAAVSVVIGATIFRFLYVARRREPPAAEAA